MPEIEFTCYIRVHQLFFVNWGKCSKAKNTRKSSMSSSTAPQNYRSGSVYTGALSDQNGFTSLKNALKTVRFWSVCTKPILSILPFSSTASNNKCCLFEDDILRSTYESSQTDWFIKYVQRTVEYSQYVISYKTGTGLGGGEGRGERGWAPSLVLQKFRRSKKVLIWMGTEGGFKC